MNVITYELKEKILYIYFHKRVDANNVNEISIITKELLDKNPQVDVIIDCEDLEYISSAGLREILKVKKKIANTKLINVNTDVYEIFDMTGFTEMMEIEKAYKKISIDGCEIIGTGANGNIYRTDPETIVKVYKNLNSLDEIKNERRLAKKAFVLGIPTAISYDICKVGEHYGTVFELLSAEPLNKLVEKYPEKMDEYINLYVNLMKKINSTIVDDPIVPSIKQVGISWANKTAKHLEEADAKKLISLFENVNDDMTMIHGDYHVKNVMIQDGEAILIDMDTISHGNVAFELAAMFSAYEGFFLDPAIPQAAFLGLSDENRTNFFTKTLKALFEVDDLNLIEEEFNKAKLISYTRILRRWVDRGALSTEQGKRTVQLYKDEIVKLLPKVNTLNMKL